MSDSVFKPAIAKENIPSGAEEESLEGLPGCDERLSGLTEVGTILSESRIVVHTDPRSAGADRFRVAQIRLKSIQASRKLKTLLITSPLPGDGKSTVALNLATSLSEKGKRAVLLLEADVYRPTLVSKLGLTPWPGLAEAFESKRDPMQAIRRIEPLGFYLLPAGQPSESGCTLLQSDFASQLIKDLGSSFFSWIVIDSPPTTPMADILVLRAHSDATLLVARAGQTPREAIEQSAQNLGREHVLGLFLNGVEGLERAYSKYYGYGKSEARAKSSHHKVLESQSLSPSKHFGFGKSGTRAKEPQSTVLEDLKLSTDGE